MRLYKSGCKQNQRFVRGLGVRMICVLLSAIVCAETSPGFSEQLQPRTAGNLHQALPWNGDQPEPDAVFRKSVSPENMVPAGHATKTTIDAITVITQKAIGHLDPEKTGAFAALRSQIFSPGKTKRLMATKDTHFGINVETGTVWARTALRFEDGVGTSALSRQLRGVVVEKFVEYPLDDFLSAVRSATTAGIDKRSRMAGTDVWAMSAQPITNQTTVTGSQGDNVTFRGDELTLDQALSRISGGTEKSILNFGCDQACAQQNLSFNDLNPSLYLFFCLAVTAAGCAISCVFTDGLACALCAEAAIQVCGVSDSVISVARFLQCITRC